METIIMSGGKGERLRPLTCNTPKPLLNILGKPVIEYILELLHRSGIDSATVTLGYLGHKLKEYLETRDFGVKLRFSEETTPLGTAGCVKHSAVGDEEDILIISGDALCDFDLKSAIDFHKQKKSPVTIIGKKVDDPREYGLIVSDSNGKITSFLEKPDYSKVVSGLANTGIYIISRDVLDLIEEGKSSDFARDIFPMLIERKMPMFVYEEKGYWCDIGSVKSYISCQEDVLSGKMKVALNFDSDGNIIKSLLPENVKITPPVFIDEGVTLEDSAVLGRGSIIEKGSIIGSVAKIKESIILKGAAIGSGVSLTGAVIDSGAFVKAGASVYEEAVIGFGATVGENAVVLPFVKVWPLKEVPREKVALENVQFQKEGKELFGEDGISGEVGIEMTPEKLLKLGRSVGLLEGKVVIGCSDSKASYTLSLSFLSGVAFSQKNAVFLPLLPLSEFLCYAASEGFDTAVFIHYDKVCSVRFFGEGGIPLSREQERKIEGNYLRGEHFFTTEKGVGKITTAAVSDEEYIDKVVSICPQGIEGNFSFVCSSGRLKAVADRIAQKLGVKAGDMVFIVSPDGTRVNGFSKKSGFVSYYKLLSLAVVGVFMRGEDIALPYLAPRIIDEIASFYGRRVLRFCEFPIANWENEALTIAKRNDFLRDGISLVVSVYAFLKEVSLDIDSALRLLPKFEISENTFEIDEPGRDIISEFSSVSSLPSDEGVYYEDELGTVYMRLARNGRSAKLFCEAASVEFSKELAIKMENIVTGKTKLDIERKK
jgi:mannose-1-phosphate guanylyltransferase/phosphomannomutase